MEEILLDAEIREGTGRAKVKDLRDKGYIPAVVYSEGKEAKPIQVSHKVLLGLVHHHRLENVVISLRIKDDKKQKPRSCLIKEIQYDPVSEDIIHVDFNEISLTKAIKINVPVVAKGEAIGVKQEGGSLEHILWEIEVECLPTNIPKEIEVDVSALKMGDSIQVKDIVAPANTKITTDPEAVVLTISAPIQEEVPAAGAEGEEQKEPEVIKEKKEVAGEEEKEEKKEK